MKNELKELIKIASENQKMLKKISQSLEVIDFSEDQLLAPLKDSLKQIARSALEKAQLSGKYDVLASHASGSDERDIVFQYVFDHVLGASFQKTVSTEIDKAVLQAQAFLKQKGVKAKVSKKIVMK